MVIRVTDVTAVPTFRANTTELDPDSGQRTVLILFSTGVSSERVNRIHSKWSLNLVHIQSFALGKSHYGQNKVDCSQENDSLGTSKITLTGWQPFLLIYIKQDRYHSHTHTHTLCVFGFLLSHHSLTPHSSSSGPGRRGLMHVQTITLSPDCHRTERGRKGSYKLVDK